ncbi:MAG: serine/threonine protein kinase [Planctomycetes bacterium]|nr:serine/threonine protein kinase [Planctomycetota bacterium]
MRPGAGAAVGPYVIEAAVASGGMGAVYRARRRDDGAVVALKLMGSDGAGPERARRFEREAELAARLRHPGIVRVHGAGVTGGQRYIAMDLIDGEPLSRLVGRLAPREAARLVAEVARAVEYAHAHGVIHRDLKPDNVLVRRDDGRPVVTDFGLAREVDGAALTRTGALVGTPTYMAPEQVRGEPATPATDVHALGVLLHEAITGRPPFERGELAALLVAIADEAPVAPGRLAAGVDPALDAAVLAALRKTASARPSAGALAAALEDVAEGRGPTRRPAGRVGVAGAAAGAIALPRAGAAFVGARPAAPPPSTSTPTPPAPPPGPPAWEEPPWLAALAARGDVAALLAAHDALDAGGDLDPRARRRAAEVLRALEARWRAPAPDDPRRVERLDTLLWLHWLWRRVDPDHALPERARLVLREDRLWAVGGRLEAAYLLRVARATCALDPTDLEAHLLYAEYVGKVAGARHDPALMRAGIALARRAGASIWPELARAHGRRLARTVDAGRPAHEDARAELLALARDVAADGAASPDDAVELLLLAAERAPTDEVQALLDAAQALAGDDPPLLRARARTLLRLGRSAPRRPGGKWLGDGARAALEALEHDLAATRASGIAASAALAWELSRELNDPGRAFAALDHAQRDGGVDAHVGLALRRAVLQAEIGLDADRLREAVDALEARLQALLDRGARAAPERELLLEVLQDARAARREGVDAARRLGRWLQRAEAMALMDGDAPP